MSLIFPDAFPLEFNLIQGFSIRMEEATQFLPADATEISVFKCKGYEAWGKHLGWHFLDNFYLTHKAGCNIARFTTQSTDPHGYSGVLQIEKGPLGVVVDIQGSVKPAELPREAGFEMVLKMRHSLRGDPTKVTVIHVGEWLYHLAHHTP